MEVFVGHDWAEAHHDVFVMGSDGARLGGGRLPEGIEGVARFHELVAVHVDDPGEVTVATETDRGLFVRGAGGGRVPSVGGQPDVDGPLPGTACDVWSEVRSW